MNHYAFLVGADDSVRPYRTRISPQTSAKPSLPTAGRTESSAPTILSYFFRLSYAAGSKGEAPLVERESPENRPKGSLVVSFFSSPGAAILFFLRKEKEKNGGANTYAAESKGASRNQTVTQQSGHSLERKKEQADTELSASAGSAVQRASSDAVARRGVGKPFERFPHALFSFGGSTPFPFLKEKRKWGRNLPFSE